MSQLEIFKAFFLLGLYSFGGPAAHIGYFHKHFVEEKNWLTEQEYTNYVALSQFLPGPGSSQVGFAIGLHRGGIAGGFFAFLGFTLPSFILMLALALFSKTVLDEPWFLGLVHGLKILAAIVVADAIIKMFQNFCSNKIGASIAFITAATLVFHSSIATQMLLLLTAGILGLFSKLSPQEAQPSINKEKPNLPALLFFLGLFTFSLFPFANKELELISNFYQTGSLVFGGGHVVLPLLQEIVLDDMNTDTFLMGYAAAQAVPGPMFSLSAFLGAELLAQSPLVGALLACIAIFLPGFLLVISLAKYWQRLSENSQCASFIAGINASVVGLLIAAFYQPIFTSGITSPLAASCFLGGFLLLHYLKLPIIFMVAGSCITGITLF